MGRPVVLPMSPMPEDLVNVACGLLADAAEALESARRMGKVAGVPPEIQHKLADEHRAVSKICQRLWALDLRGQPEP